MDLRDVLEKIGLTANEAKLYLIILEKSNVTPGELAKAAELHRSSIYDTLKMLKHKGLIADVRINNKHYFKPINPQKFIDIQKEKIQLITEHMPQLLSLHLKEKPEQEIKVYTGLGGIKAIFEDIMREGKDVDVFGSESDYEQKLTYHMHQFKRHFEKNGLRIRHIVRQGVFPDKPETGEVRYIQSETKSPVTTDIYGNKIAIILWSDEPNGIIIKNKLAADSYRSYFNFMWQNAAKS